MALRDSLDVAGAEVSNVLMETVTYPVSVNVVVCGQPGGKLVLELVEVPVDVLLVLDELVVVEVVELPYSLFLAPYAAAETEELSVAVPHNVNLDLGAEIVLVMIV